MLPCGDEAIEVLVRLGLTDEEGVLGRKPGWPVARLHAKRMVQPRVGHDDPFGGDAEVLDQAAARILRDGQHGVGALTPSIPEHARCVGGVRLVVLVTRPG